MQPIFNDISNFNNTSDYLPILVGVLYVETFVLSFTFLSKRSLVLESWYKKYRLAAVLADVLIVIIGIIIARFLYPYFFSGFSIINFITLALAVQIIHDVLFYIFFSSIPKGYNAMLDTFKAYAREIGAYAILGDSLIIIFSCLFASSLVNYSANFNIICLIFTLYLIPYLTYYK